MKKSSKNSKRKEENNNQSQINNSEIIQNMQKKIKDQAKRLMSMQEYISTLETTLRENNQSDNSLRNLNINKDQATQNEFFENNNNIIKNDLKECLNFLKEKLLIKEKEEKIGNEAYNEILEEILEIKKENEKNLEEKKFLEEKIEEYENSIGDLRQNMDLINKLNNENNNLYNQNVALENELNELKNIYEENQKELNEIKQQNYLLIKDNQDFININTNIIKIKQENDELISTLNNLQVKLNEALNENESLKDYKLGYELVLKENNEIKEVNNFLSNDNMLLAQDVYNLKNNLDKLTQTGINSDKIKSELNELKDTLDNLKTRKQINNIFEHMTELENKNKLLEEQLLYKKENNAKNKTDYLDNMIYSYKNKNKNNKNKDNKYILANKYYSDILLRILKYHVKEDINIKNILFQLLDLNHKKIGLMSDIENLLSNKMKDTNKKRNEINKKKKELENVENTINYFDKELKKYEPK